MDVWEAPILRRYRKRVNGMEAKRLSESWAFGLSAVHGMQEVLRTPGDAEWPKFVVADHT